MNNEQNIKNIKDAIGELMGGRHGEIKAIALVAVTQTDGGDVSAQLVVPGEMMIETALLIAGIQAVNAELAAVYAQSARKNEALQKGDPDE